MLRELADVVVAPPQQVFDLSGGAVAEANPDQFGRGSPQQGEAVKILVLTDQQAAMLASKIPDAEIRSPTEAEQANVQRRWVETRKPLAQGFRELLVEEQPHRSSRGNADSAAFALGRVSQAGPDVVGGELGKVGQQLLG